MALREANGSAEPHRMGFGGYGAISPPDCKRGSSAASRHHVSLIMFIGGGPHAERLRYGVSLPLRRGGCRRHAGQPLQLHGPEHRR